MIYQKNNKIGGVKEYSTKQFFEIVKNIVNKRNSCIFAAWF